jgi:integrase
MASLGPIMRIAALTGARIDAIVSLRVKDCDNGVFRFKPQKREKRERYVPIHSTLVPIIEELVRGKKPGRRLAWRVPGATLRIAKRTLDACRKGVY